MLCRFKAYLEPGLPRPTTKCMKTLFNYDFNYEKKATCFWQSRFYKKTNVENYFLAAGAFAAGAFASLPAAAAGAAAAPAAGAAAAAATGVATTSSS